MTTYRTDFYQWIKDQVDALRRRDPTKLDWENLSEEIESLGKREQREVAARLKTLTFHLIQWRYQPELQCGGGGARSTKRAAGSRTFSGTIHPCARISVNACLKPMGTDGRGRWTKPLPSP